MSGVDKGGRLPFRSPLASATACIGEAIPWDYNKVPKSESSRATQEPSERTINALVPPLYAAGQRSMRRRKVRELLKTLPGIDGSGLVFTFSRPLLNAWRTTRFSSVLQADPDRNSPV